MLHTRHTLHVLAAEAVGKRYGRRWVFRGISFELTVGDRLAVLGPNGSGKSTLLKVLAGLLPASEGKVGVGSDDPRSKLGYSALEQSLYPHLNVEEHLRLAADLRGCDPRVDDMLRRVGLEAARRKLAIELSTGMKARLKLALAIQAEPIVLLLDEPGASMDEQGRQLVEQIVHEQAARGCLVFATNDPDERRLANAELELVA